MNMHLYYNVAYAHIGYLLRRLRTQQGETTIELARRVHMSQSKISRIETGFHKKLPRKEVETILTAHQASDEVRAEVIRQLDVKTPLAHGVRTDFNSYLFGSITTTGSSDLIVLLVATAIVLAVIAFNYRAFLHIAFDEDSAIIAGYKVKTLNYILAALTAVIVVLSLRIVGGLLISALLVMPVVTASRFAHSFAQTILFAVIAAMVAVIGGLVAAFYIGVAAGGAIVLAALTLLILSLLLGRN